MSKIGAERVLFGALECNGRLLFLVMDVCGCETDAKREVEMVRAVNVGVAVRHPQHHLASAPCNVPCQTLFKILESICACYRAFIKAWL